MSTWLYGTTTKCKKKKNRWWKLENEHSSSSIMLLIKNGLAVFLFWRSESPCSFLWAGPVDGRLSVDVGGPVSQVEDEEEHWKDDTRDLVHFADAIVWLSYTLRHVFAIHFGQSDLSDRLWRGGCGCGCGALGDGRQPRIFGYAHAVGGSHDVESVVGLLRKGRWLSSLWKCQKKKNRAIINKRSELSVLLCKSETFILLMELLVHLFSLTAQNMTHFWVMCVHFFSFFFK